MHATTMLLAAKRPPAEVMQGMETMGGWLIWIAALAGVAALILIGGTLWMARKQGEFDTKIGEVIVVICAGVVIGSASLIAGVLLTSANS